MGQKTGIEWTESTWNPIRGCSQVSEGCRNCYAETVANRFKGPGEPYEGLIAKGGQWNGEVKLIQHKLQEPLRWKKPRRIFVNSMSDLFHENVPDSFIDQVFAVMAMTTRHTYQILTKRPERMRDYITNLTEAAKDEQFAVDNELLGLPDRISNYAIDHINKGADNCGPLWPLHNVWLGVSVEDQPTADERIPQLLETPAAVRWISAEPLLGPIILDDFLFRGDHSLRETDPLAAAMLAEAVADGHGWIRPAIDWVVVGGESGPGARPMHPYWARYLRDRCQAAEVPFLFKQWGEFAPSPDGGLPDDLPESAGYYFEDPHPPGKTWRFGKKRAGRMLDGEVWDQYPELAQ